MEVVKVEEQHYDREHDGEIFGKLATHVKDSYVRRFLVLTDDPLMDQYRVQTHATFTANIPAYLASYQSPDGLLTISHSKLMRRTLKQDEAVQELWWVHCYYQPAYDMLQEPADISIGFRQYTKAVDKFINYLGDQSRSIAAVNSAGDPYDPVLEDEFSDAVMRIVKYETYNIATEHRIATYNDSLNQATFRAWPARTCRMAIGAERVLVCGTYYYRVSYEINYKRDGWLREVMNRGYREKLADGTIKNIFVGPSMSNTAQPALLDATGKRTTTPTYKTYSNFVVRDWSVLGLESVF
jgi:hypothetical protein